MNVCVCECACVCLYVCLCELVVGFLQFIYVELQRSYVWLTKYIYKNTYG